MLRLSITDLIPEEVLPMLTNLFAESFDEASFQVRTFIIKVFLQVLPNLDAKLLSIFAPTSVGQKARYCIDEGFSRRDRHDYATALAILDDLFEHEDLLGCPLEDESN
jgi:hypothetical protein